MGSGVQSKIDELLKRGSRDEQLTALCAYARDLLGANDADGAHVVMDRAVRLDGRSPSAWTLRGEVLARRNRAGEALGSYDRALDLDPKNITAMVGKADLLLKIGSSAEAIEQYELAVKTEPAHAHLWMNRARALDTAGRTIDAIASIDRAIELSDAPATWVLRGEIQLKANQLADARGSFERAVEIDPNAIDAWYHLGLVCAKAKDVEAAKNACYKFLDVAKEGDPRNAAMRSLLFQLDRHGTPQMSGVQQRRPAQRLSSSRMRRVSRGLRTVSVPPPSEATIEPAPASNRQVADVSDYEDTLADLVVADSLHREGRHREALAKLEVLLKLQPKEPNAWMLRASVCHALGKMDLAAQSIEHTLELETRSANAWKLAARIFTDLKRFDRVNEAVERAMKLAPNDAEVHRLRAGSLAIANRHTEAVYAYEKALMYGPDHAETWLALGRLLRLMRRPEPAREALEKARDLAESANQKDVATEARSLLVRLG